jgi:hypothetical protein
MAESPDLDLDVMALGARDDRAVGDLHRTPPVVAKIASEIHRTPPEQE